ncbi:hypothetical protein CTI14_62465, partial [Methylobacterium radiotolerans]
GPAWAMCETVPVTDSPALAIFDLDGTLIDPAGRASPHPPEHERRGMDRAIHAERSCPPRVRFGPAWAMCETVPVTDSPALAIFDLDGTLIDPAG